jgi:hypothetical protein
MPSVEASEGVVTFIFPGMGQQMTGKCRMPYTGAALVHYLHLYPLRQQGLLGFLGCRGKAFNKQGQIVRRYYVPVVGDVVVFALTR